MKVKTSVTLSLEALQAILEFVERRRRARRDARDLEILNRSADVLNDEMENILGHQVEPSKMLAGCRRSQPN
jgi:hypothetical protein